MKLFFAVLAMVFACLAWSVEKSVPAETSVLKGEVLEVKNVDSYSYLRLKTADGETWAAVTKTPLKKGAKVVIENATVMYNFESKSLKKTFPQIVFGNLSGAGVVGGGDNINAAHGSLAKPADVGDVNVPKASGADARTVAEIVTKSAELKDKTVQVRGKVVKFTGEVMGKNWIHLRDGSGAAADGSNDVLVTTKDQAKIGDVVLVKGTVRVDKDFGSGYAYKVLVEEASLQK